METFCGGSNCSKRETCKLYGANNRGDHYYIDYSKYGSGGVSCNPETNECTYYHKYWCGDDSKNYELHQPMSKEEILAKIKLLNEQIIAAQSRMDECINELMT